MADEKKWRIEGLKSFQDANRAAGKNLDALKRLCNDQLRQVKEFVYPHIR